MTRGDRVESIHDVDAVIVTATGVVVDSWGDPDRLVLPRSASKPIQALPLVVTGAADAFDLTNVELALACSSHNAEPAHVSAVARWLALIGATPDDLECGAHAPLVEEAAADLFRSGGKPDASYNNCSGKHAGFLTVCRHVGLDFPGYLEASHPLQRDHVTPALEDWCGLDLSDQVPGVDGCGIPVWAIPLKSLAAGWARLGSGPVGSPEHRLLTAMRAEPFLVAGTGRACTRLISDSTGGVVVKTGAEGVFCGTVPDDGLGISLKVRDGAGRASGPAMAWLLRSLDRLDGGDEEMVVNRAGTVVGAVRVVG
ncbi:MAG: asparaginase [Acidimicrobiia bacterium]|nr:asparaginase [Acidimicrobiia bacterium]MBL6926734.1 asparaginase [Acidimicrobiia bacterium]